MILRYSELLDLKNKFTKLKSELDYSRKVNNKLLNQVTNLERKYWEKEQDSRREFIEIFRIPQSIKQIDLKKTMLNVFRKVDAPVEPHNIEAYGSTIFRHISTIFFS